MARYYILLLVTLSIFHPSLQDTNDNDVDTEDVNPFAEAAAAILKEQTGQNIGSMVNQFMQSGGAAKIGDALSRLGRENTGQLLLGLSSLIRSNDKEEDGEGDSTANLLGSLGSLMGALQGAGGGDSDNAAGAILQGLGSLLGGQGGREGQGGIDPAMIGSLINMFVNQKPSPKSSKPAQKKSQAKVDRTRPKDEMNLDLGDILSLAGNFLGNTQGDNPAGGLLNYLPMIMQTISAFNSPASKKRAESHSDHSWMLPPFLEKFHIAFDNFIHSDMGKHVINAMGAEKAFKVFTDENGRFNYPKFVEMMENRSFRRHWIRMVTDRIVDMLQYAHDPNVQKSYLANAQFFINSFLKAQGFPKSTLFDSAKPTETITALVNYVAKKYFDLKIYSKEYVKAGVAYVQELARLTQKNASSGSEGSAQLSDKLADTINLEIIEPIARVNRAYRFTKSVPSCDRYVFCLVNEENTNEQEGLPGLKKLLYKGASLLASWFLSGETGTPFWTLYSDITDGNNCKALYSEKCHDFHVEEIKVTTEYVHSEL
uniref:Uncharacterized protein n=1 Tax=Anoplophora glabripennis TaxID=217634 RepID=V5GIN9_ANOGL